MKIKSLSYSEFENESKEWILKDFQINDINLIVGKNSDGKTRTLNVIKGLATILSSAEVKLVAGNYKVEFEDDGNLINYKIKFYKKAVIDESMSINGEEVLQRSVGGKGSMKNELVHQHLSFEIPTNQPAVTRRDAIQYPYLQRLYNWGLNVRHFQFNTELGKKFFPLVDSGLYNKEVNLNETDKVIELFIRGNKDFPKKFKAKVIEDFNSIGYEITDISISPLESIQIEADLPGKLNGLVIQEKDRKGVTDQFAMSMGMFRALAIILYFNYYELSEKPGTVLIDDIGEGLDFERSTSLIKLLTNKCSNNLFQIIMSTNDRFVMNNTPLDYWQIISRKGGVVKMYNRKNSPETFNDFEFTGLNNFDFFATGFFKEGFKEQSNVEK